MITLLLLFYFSQSSATAIPLFSASGDILACNTSIVLPVGTPACTCPDQRSIWDIIWSCLATIFACTWVSVHPDIPDRDEKWWIVTLRRVELVVWTLLTPELVIFWAINQWRGAQLIVKEQKGGFDFQRTSIQRTDLPIEDKGWGRTHGYFIQMGGFMMYDGDQKIGTLSYPRFKELLAKNRIDFPTITQEDIEDRSKSDGLSKLLVIGQTGWFILQCITRRIGKFPLTELELATLAFAALNWCMYLFWWNKPFDVQVPVCVNLRREKSEDQSAETSMGELKGTPDTAENEGSKYSALVPTEGRSNVSEERLSDQQVSWLQMITGPWTILKMMGGRLDAIIPDTEGFTEFNNPRRPEAEIGPKQVPTFYSLYTTEDSMPELAICAIGTMFGVIHCAGWFFHFPTVAELWIWRISSLYIAIYTILLVAMIYLVIALTVEESESPIPSVFRNTLKPVIIVFVVLGILLYIIARFLLLAECLTTLRDLPPGVYDVVQWTIRIPHI